MISMKSMNHKKGPYVRLERFVHAKILKHQLGLQKEAIHVILNVNIFPALIIDLFSCSQVAFNRCNTFQMIINNLRAVKHKTLGESPTHPPSSLTLWFYDVFITIFNIRLYKKSSADVVIVVVHHCRRHSPHERKQMDIIQS